MFLPLVRKSMVMTALAFIFLMLVSPAPAQNIGNNDVGTGNVGDNDIGNNNIGNNDRGNNNVGDNDIGNNNVGSNDTGNNNVGSNDTGNNLVGDNLTGNADPAVPEVNPGSAAAALALLASGMLLLTDKRR